MTSLPDVTSMDEEQLRAFAMLDNLAHTFLTPQGGLMAMAAKKELARRGPGKIKLVEPQKDQEGAMPFIEAAHTSLSGAVSFSPKLMPITVVSVNDTHKGQLVMFDGAKWSKSEVVKRLRAAADFLEAHL